MHPTLQGMERPFMMVSRPVSSADFFYVEERPSQNGLDFVLSGRRLVHPTLQGTESPFMMISRPISQAEDL